MPRPTPAKAQRSVARRPRGRCVEAALYWRLISVRALWLSAYPSVWRNIRLRCFEVRDSCRLCLPRCTCMPSPATSAPGLGSPLPHLRRDKVPSGTCRGPPPFGAFWSQAAPCPICPFSARARPLWACALRGEEAAALVALMFRRPLRAAATCSMVRCARLRADCSEDDRRNRDYLPTVSE